MKKITKSFFALASGILLVSAVNATNPVNSGISPSMKKVNKVYSKPNIPHANSPTSRWYNMGETMDQFYQGNSVLNFNYLFPDSEITAQFGTEYGNPFVHMIGTVLDVTSSRFNDPVAYPPAEFMYLAPSNKYKVDSVEVVIAYTRVNNTITDSLIVEVGVNPAAAANSSQLPEFFFTGMSANFGVDTLRFRAMRYTQSTNRWNWPTTGGATKRRYAIALNDSILNDTLENGLLPIKIATPDLPISNGNRLCAAIVQFKPGYTYTLDDTLNSLNHVVFASFEEQDGGFPLYQVGDRNCSHITPTEVRYNQSPGPSGWNGYFIPAYAYTAPFAFENHYISFKISSLCTGDLAVTLNGTPPVDLNSGSITAIATGGTPPYTYAWNPPSGTSPTISGLNPGAFTVTVTDANGCTIQQSLVLTSNRELEIEPAAVSVMPNPTTGKVTLQFHSTNDAAAQIRVFAVNGQEMMTENINQSKGMNVHNMDISNLSKGVYFIQIQTEKSRVTKKLIKN